MPKAAGAAPAQDNVQEPTLKAKSPLAEVTSGALAERVLAQTRIRSTLAEMAAGALAGHFLIQHFLIQKHLLFLSAHFWCFFHRILAF